MRRTLLVLALGVGLACAAPAQVPDVPTPDTLGANFRHDSVGTSSPTDFDFLDGRWNIRFQVRRQDGTYNEARVGTWTGRKTHGGQIIEDEFSLINSAAGTRSLTLTYRLYNSRRKTWEITGASVSNGTPWAPGVSWSDGRDRFVVQTYGTGPDALITRIRYYQITPDHFLWRADGSTDGGKTWIRDMWKMEATRAR